ncbi:MAG: hypothetical protein K2X72_24880 [Reyranella sp.]|nr:hypothetical protein [Reyranella sp.]
MSHSATSQAGILAEGLAKCPHAFEPSGFPGFGYLLGPPDEATGQRSRLGADPAEAHRLLLALSKVLPRGAGFWKAPLTDDNPSIPSGYTYLLQLVAHDAVQTSVPFWVAAKLGLASRNLRSAPFVLDTLYGGGPTGSAVAYQSGDSSLLLLGRYKSQVTGIAATAAERPFRDLGRINPVESADGLVPANFDHPHVTCVADDRNDDNIILAQLVALFANVHDAIAKKLRKTQPEASPEAVFGYAQVAMQRIYHAIIGRDLLPKLLHPQVWATLVDRAADDPRWLWRTGRMPLEFTHGAFRIGHAMVRRDYKLNDLGIDPLSVGQTITIGRNVGDSRDPLQQAWLVRWSRFFKMQDADTPNLSRRISPTMSALDVEGVFNVSDGKQPENLAVRDMLSAALARTWRVDALLDQILAQNQDPIPPGWMFRDGGQRREVIRGWLTAQGLSDTDSDTLADDPPLPFFVLLEAALDPEILGRHLGPLASIIIGEVIWRSVILERQRMAATECVARAAFKAPFWDEMAAIESMPGLVAFAARHCGFDGAAPMPFA